MSKEPTIAEIKAQLDELGLKYPSSGKREVYVGILEAHKSAQEDDSEANEPTEPETTTNEPESFTGVDPETIDNVIVQGTLLHNGEKYERGTEVPAETFGEYLEGLLADGTVAAA